MCLSKFYFRQISFPDSILDAGHSELENIDKFPLEGTSPPSPCLET